MMSPPSQYQMAPPPPPPPQSSSYSHGSMMMASQTPFLSALDPPVSSSAYSNPPMKNQYDLSPEVPRWDRQEPEYRHVDEATEAVVAPDVIVADTVDEKSTDSEKVEKVHENERLARMDLKYEEPENLVMIILI
uniref:Ovule protein n=1 Tax=Caenorhabditis tropicalis TaxID=1561998 RepID=A0A1I7UJF7_9PELO